MLSLLAFARRNNSSIEVRDISGVTLSVVSAAGIISGLTGGAPLP